MIKEMANATVTGGRENEKTMNVNKNYLLVQISMII
jgi:hypothetical protein